MLSQADIKKEKEFLMMKNDQTLYTKEKDGTIQKWYLWGRAGNQIAVSTVKNAKLKDYKRYYYMDDIGEKIFLSRTEANEKR